MCDRWRNGRAKYFSSHSHDSEFTCDRMYKYQTVLTTKYAGLFYYTYLSINIICIYLKDLKMIRSENCMCRTKSECSRFFLCKYVPVNSYSDVGTLSPFLMKGNTDSKLPKNCILHGHAFLMAEQLASAFRLFTIIKMLYVGIMVQKLDMLLLKSVSVFEYLKTICDHMT